MPGSSEYQNSDFTIFSTHACTHTHTHKTSYEAAIFIAYFLNIIQWKKPGRMKARKVQQLEPTRAMRVEKSGIASTTRPDTTTRPVRNTHWYQDEGGGKGGVQHKGYS